MTELTDFLDAEYGLQRGEHAWHQSAVDAGVELVEEFDVEPGELRRKLVADRGMRLLAVKQWLRVARKGCEVLPGTAMARGFRAVSVFATVGGLFVGLGAGRTALSAPSGEPINLWLCLGVLVLLQIGILLGAVTLLVVARIRGRQWLGAFTNLLKWLHRWSWAKRVRDSELLQAMPRTQRVERWIWLGLTQRFAVCFNFGALLMFVSMLVFRELQFGWSTTLTSFEAQHIQALVEFLAAPWGWAFPDNWVPNRIVIEGTQWDALAGQFRSPNADGRAWWPFVMMNLLFWGLIPRLLLLRWAANGQRKELQRLDWNHRRLQDLFDVMLPVGAAPRSSAFVGGKAATTTATTAPLSVDGISADPFAVIAWGDWNSALELQAGGRDLHSDETLVAQLAKRTLTTLQVVVEAGEAPDKRLTSFLSRLRAELGRDCLIQVCPIEVDSADASHWSAPSERDLIIWRRTLANLRDDHLHVSAFAPESPGGA